MIFTDQNFNQEVEKSQDLVLVDFFAPWCGPCKAMEPIIDGLIAEYKDMGVKIGKLDVDENQTTAGKYNVMGVPTLILFKDGKIVEQTSGLQNKDDLKQMIEKYRK